MEKDGELTERKARILRAVVLEYVIGAEPIPSDLLVSKYDLGAKSATIRSELADITELGLLEQPHTSAGRIPSDLGYRYYVDRLMVREAASAEDRQQVQSVQSDEDTLKELLTETTKALARLTTLFAAAATIKDNHVPVRHVVVTALGPERAMLVLVLGNGHVENRIITLPAGTSLDSLGKANEALMASLPGKTLGQLARHRVPSTGQPEVDRILAEACGIVRSAAKDLTRGHFITDGEEFILAQPEFRRNQELMEALVRHIDNEDLLRAAVVDQPRNEDGVTIGRENEREELAPLAISRRVFFVGDQEAGALAIIGPTRQDYNRGLSLLDYTAQAVSKTLTKLFG
jgi:heat-inducible transcriptional repressor